MVVMASWYLLRRLNESPTSSAFFCRRHRLSNHWARTFDLRFLKPWVSCKPLMCNVLRVAATALLPLLGPVFASSGDVQ